MLRIPDVLLRILIDFAGIKVEGSLSIACKQLKEDIAVADANRKTLRSSDDPRRCMLLTQRAGANLVSLDLKDCDWDDDACRSLKNKLPKLSHLDLSGARYVTTNGLKALSSGGKLISFVCNSTRRHSLCKNMKVTPGYIKSLAKISTLRQVRVTGFCQHGA